MSNFSQQLLAAVTTDMRTTAGTTASQTTLLPDSSTTLTSETTTQHISPSEGMSSLSMITETFTVVDNATDVFPGSSPSTVEPSATISTVTKGLTTGYTEELMTDAVNTTTSLQPRVTTTDKQVTEDDLTSESFVTMSTATEGVSTGYTEELMTDVTSLAPVSSSEITEPTVVTDTIDISTSLQTQTTVTDNVATDNDLTSSQFVSTSDDAVTTSFTEVTNIFGVTTPPPSSQAPMTTPHEADATTTRPNPTTIISTTPYIPNECQYDGESEIFIQYKTSASISISWSVPPNTDAVRVEHTTTSSEDWLTSKPLETNLQLYTITGLQSDTLYNIRLRAIDSDQNMDDCKIDEEQTCEDGFEGIDCTTGMRN